MKVPYSWLRESCPLESTLQELADVLTIRGAKVESIVRPWDRLAGVVVARVLDVRDHPKSETLCLARVDAGEEEREVVVGVRNMRPGDAVPLAPPGATLPGMPRPLEAREIRGVRSDGMLCSPRELGISGDHTAILILPTDAEVGSDVKEAFGLDDTVLDIEVTPNRPDLMSVIGVAREAAAATGVEFVPPATDVREGEDKAAEAVTVEIVDLDRCPRYLARVIRGVSVGPSSVRVQARLTASGMRPVSNVVDATNYALLEMGHPLHPFDLVTLEGPGIMVRRAEHGDRFTTLDGAERTMSAEDLMICDRGRSVAVAGIMGGASTEVSASTQDVLLESAYFEPVGILRTARRLELRTEASTRFERGADPEAVGAAADRAAALIADWSGGTVLAGSVEAGSVPSRKWITVRPQRASLIYGRPVGTDDVREAFARLGMRTEEREGAVAVEAPGYRVDLHAEIDLVEEVIRVHGYDRVGSTMPGVRQAGGVPEEYAFRRRVREALVRAGLRETWSMSFASRDDLALMGDGEAIRVTNPLAADQAFLRTSLVPGVLRAVRTNRARHGIGSALFEVGRVFRPGKPVEEAERIAIALSGSDSTGYPGEARDLDFLDAKGVVEALFGSIGAPAWTLGGPAGPPFHPGRSALVLVRGQEAGVMGELHPRIAESLDLPGRVALAELDGSALAGARKGQVAYREVPRFPPVHRDLAFVVDEGVPAGALREALVHAGGGLVDTATLFDVFAGPPIPEGKKSLAFAVAFRVVDRTLTDQEADEAVGRIVERLSRSFSAELRSG